MSQLKHKGLHVLQLRGDNNNTLKFYSIFHLGLSRCAINSVSLKIIHAVKLQISCHYAEVKSIKKPGMDANPMKKMKLS